MEPETPPTTPAPTTTPETPAADPPSLVAEAAAPPVTPEVKAEEKPAEEPAYVFPEAELKIPDGFEVNEEVKGNFIKLATEHKLTPAAANALVELQANMTKAAAEQQIAFWQKTQNTWREEVKAHPEIGGDKLEGVLQNVAKVVDKYGSPELREVMTLTGAGNNVHVVAFLAKIAKDVTEAGPVVGAPVSAPKSLAESMFTTMKGSNQ